MNGKKLIAIIGMPGTGKTTLMREWMSTREWVQDKPIDLVESHVCGKIRVLGKYEDGQPFAGTDRLSMAVQPKVIEYLQHNDDDVIIFEGDRLTSKQVFSTAVDLGYDVRIIELVVSDSERERRYKVRGSEQSENFISGRRTKVRNVVDAFSENFLTDEPGIVDTYTHLYESDTEIVASQIELLLSC